MFNRRSILKLITSIPILGRLAATNVAEPDGNPECRHLNLTSVILLDGNTPIRMCRMCGKHVEYVKPDRTREEYQEAIDYINKIENTSLVSEPDYNPYKR